MAICDQESFRVCFGMQGLPDLDPHPAIMLVLTPFAVIFLWAAWVEFRRWWRYGPSQNRRNAFPIDESAPSYEPPPQQAPASAPEKDEEQECRNDRRKDQDRRNRQGQ